MKYLSDIRCSFKARDTRQWLSWPASRRVISFTVEEDLICLRGKCVCLRKIGVYAFHKKVAKTGMSTKIRP